MKAFTALAEILEASTAIISELNALAGAIGGLYDKRNGIVHDPKMIKQATGAVQRLQVTAKPKIHFGFIEETAAEVIKVADDLAAKGREFMKLRDTVIAQGRVAQWRDLHDPPCGSGADRKVAPALQRYQAPLVARLSSAGTRSHEG